MFQNTSCIIRPPHLAAAHPWPLGRQHDSQMHENSGAVTKTWSATRFEFLSPPPVHQGSQDLRATMSFNTQMNDHLKATRSRLSCHSFVHSFTLFVPSAKDFQQHSAQLTHRKLMPVGPHLLWLEATIQSGPPSTISDRASSFHAFPRLHFLE